MKEPKYSKDPIIISEHKLSQILDNYYKQTDVANGRMYRTFRIMDWGCAFIIGLAFGWFGFSCRLAYLKSL